MGRRLPWALLHRQVLENDGQKIVENLNHEKQHEVAVSNTSKCTVCIETTFHLMRNRVLECTSKVCAAACVAPIKCQWRYKVLVCGESGVTNIYEIGSHKAHASDPPSGQLTYEQKAISRQLAASGVKPSAIRNDLASKTTVDKILRLDKVQNFVTHFQRSELNNTDEMEVLERIVKGKAYHGQEPDVDAFTFPCSGETVGEITVGEGTDQSSFIVGFTTKTLLRRLDRDPHDLIFHVDATYTLNQVDYPTSACGISDHARSFHLVALFVASQQEEAHYTAALVGLRAIYARVLHKPMKVHYILGDADGAQYNAMATVFEDCDLDILVCFYHVVAKVHERTRSILPGKRSLVVSDVFDMHYAKSGSAFQSTKNTPVRRWLADPDVQEFANIFCGSG